MKAFKNVSYHSLLFFQLKDILHNLFKCLHYPYTSVRHMAARCLGKLGKIITSDTMNIVLTKVANILGQSDNIIGRQGAIETLVCIFSLFYTVLSLSPMTLCFKSLTKFHLWSMMQTNYCVGIQFWFVQMFFSLSYRNPEFRAKMARICYQCIYLDCVIHIGDVMFT